MIVEMSSIEEAVALPAGAVVPVDEPAYRVNTPTLHIAELDGDGRLVARCSIWRGRDSRGVPTRTGLVGHFAAGDADSPAGGGTVVGHRDAPASGGTAASSWPHPAAAVLARACAILAEEGCTRVVGPMDGSTWYRYRFVTERSEEPPFFLEPDNPESWPATFRAGGFETLATYTSALATDLTATDPRTPERIDNLHDAGIRIRALAPEELTAELARLYDLSAAAFTDNFLYSPIDRRAFVEMYLSLEPYLVPELVQLAEKEGVLVGYVFGIPDLLAAKRGDEKKTMIVKTVAVDPAHAGMGLGSVLVDLCQQAGHALGFERAIHALMHETNRSRNISSRYGRTIRRYTLFARDLPA